LTLIARHSANGYIITAELKVIAPLSPAGSA
jgi:hypothetical protein